MAEPTSSDADTRGAGVYIEVGGRKRFLKGAGTQHRPACADTLMARIDRQDLASAQGHHDAVSAAGERTRGQFLDAIAGLVPPGCSGSDELPDVLAAEEAGMAWAELSREEGFRLGLALGAAVQTELDAGLDGYVAGLHYGDALFDVARSFDG
jgi:hypothetical protein